MSRNDIFSHYPEKIAIPPGETAEIKTIPGQNCVTLKYDSGGSLLIVGATNASGTTYAISNEYMLGRSEVLNINLSGTIYLMASGSTSVCYLLRYRTHGF